MDNIFMISEVLLFFLAVAGCLLIKLDTKQPKPYMDEIFHVPQAQKYCNGEFYEVCLGR